MRKTSIIKTEKITVIHQSLVRKELGSLSFELMQQVRKILRKTLEIE
ncbi:MAG: type II toxin-antitoxin system PemK/MazF family toxin [Candidatus Kuenenia stuttgartiensis]|nr:type II toxin-antitoxin system PemK/MazF family toxin [Candidatus Kuenenia stuttgartiensis]